MLPNFLIIGAMNCGTTSLHYYLDLHPEISMSSEKELDFFVKELNYKKGIDWYKSQFKNSGIKIRGEASPNYTKYPKYKGVPQRILRHIPDIKLIYLIRNPIDRIKSHYYHNLSKGREKRTLEKSLSNIKNNHYIYCSKYFLQISKYLKYFPKENIYVIKSEDLLTSRKLVLMDLFKYLEVDHKYNNIKFKRVLHKSSDKKIYLNPNDDDQILEFTKRRTDDKENDIQKLDDELRSEILGTLKDDIMEMQKFSGLDLSEWLNY